MGLLRLCVFQLTEIINYQEKKTFLTTELQELVSLLKFFSLCAQMYSPFLTLFAKVNLKR